MSEPKLKLGERLVTVAVKRKLWAQVKFIAEERDVKISRVLNEILAASFKSVKEEK